MLGLLWYHIHMNNKFLKVENLWFNYEKGFNVFNGLSFTVSRGERVCVLGNNQSGKTTLLKLIAGLEKQAQGDVFFKGTNLKDVPLKNRSFSFLPEKAILFENKTVRFNLEYVFKLQGKKKDENIKNEIENVLVLFGLKEVESLKIKSLSNGKKQLTALARSYIKNPELLLIDDIFKHVNTDESQGLLAAIKKLVDKSSEGALCVFNGKNKALFSFDRFLILGFGGILDYGSEEKIKTQMKHFYIFKEFENDRFIRDKDMFLIGQKTKLLINEKEFNINIDDTGVSNCLVDNDGFCNILICFKNEKEYKGFESINQSTLNKLIKANDIFIFDKITGNRIILK